MNSGSAGFTPLEYHLLLALADGERHGYALRDAIAEESDGTLDPQAGTLYRVLARMVSIGLVRESDGPPEEETHPGRPRRYYRLTEAGRTRLLEETRRLDAAVRLAERRLRRADR